MLVVQDEAIESDPSSAAPARSLGLLEAGTLLCGSSWAVLVGVDGSPLCGHRVLVRALVVGRADGG
jgi:hypothetical protein